MPRYYINQFLVESEINLTVPATACPSMFSVDRLFIHHTMKPPHEFDCVHWVGRRHGGQFLRAYDVGIGLLVCAGNQVMMLIEKSGHELKLAFDANAPCDRALGEALAINLGISLCTLLQGDVPIHGAGVEIDSALISISGPSGVGKSTLLWTLLNNGARFASDDVIPVRPSQLSAVAFPSVSLPSKLSAAALEKFGMDTTCLNPVFDDRKEFWVPIPLEERVIEPRPLNAIVVLRPFPLGWNPGGITIKRHNGASAFSLLMEHTQGLWAAHALVDARQLITRFAYIASATPVFTLEYERSLRILPELARTIRQIATVTNNNRSTRLSVPMHPPQAVRRRPLTPRRSNVTISVILTTHNRSRYLDLALASFEQQILPRDLWEVIVVDQASQDSTVGIIDRYEQEGNFHLVKRSVDLRFGRPAMLNDGISVARGRYIVFFGDDRIARPDLLARYLLSQKRSAAVILGHDAQQIHTHIMDLTESGIAGVELNACVMPGDIRAWRKLATMIVPLDGCRSTLSAYFKRHRKALLFPWAYFSFANSCVPRSFLDKVGPIDEYFDEWGLEEIDLAYRLHNERFPFRYDERAVSLQQVRQSRMGRNRSLKSNIFYFLGKHRHLEEIERELVLRNTYFPIE